MLIFQFNLFTSSSAFKLLTSISTDALDGHTNLFTMTTTIDMDSEDEESITMMEDDERSVTSSTLFQLFLVLDYAFFLGVLI